MTKTIEQEALDLINEVGPYECANVADATHVTLIKALRRTLESHAATKAEFEAFRRKVSEVAHVAMSIMDEMSKPLLMGRNVKDRLDKAREGLAPLILPKPDPLAQVAREMVLLDGVVRTDNQKAAIHEGRAANTAADDFYDRLRAALAARGLKLVEAGDDD